MVLFYKLFFLFLTYLWGSIPFGYLLIRIYTGKNLLELGSGNVGSTNVRRVAGKKLANITQLLDMFKGLLPVLLYLVLNTDTTNPYYIFMLAMSAIIGHDFSLFLKFKGGKGVNTTLGASVLLTPYAVFISVAIYFIIKWKFKFVSLGSIVLAIAMPIVELIFHQITTTFYYLCLSSVLIIFLHRQNIIRLINGNELRA